MVLGDGCVLNVAAVTVINPAIAEIRGKRKLPGRDDVAMNKAADVLIRGDEAQRCDVADGKIQHQAAAAVRAAAGGLRGVDLGCTFQGFELGRVGNQFDRTAHRPCAVQRSLRSTQYLGAVEIEEVGVDDRAAVQRHCGRRQGRLIEIEAYRRHGAAGGGQAAHLVLGLARTRRAQGDTGDGADEVLDRCDVLVGKIARAQGRHRDRRCLDGRLALFCGDDDLFQPGVFGRRVAGRGCQRRATQGHGTQKRRNHRCSDSRACVCCTQHSFHVRISLK